MPNDPGTALTPTQQFNAQLDAQVQNFRALLPSHISVEKFKRVVVVAIAQNPALFKAERRSLFMAAQKCAADGLLPDGRQAALVIFGQEVSYLPMIAGIRQRMRNSGEVLSAEAHVVYRNDKFFQKLGDDPAIVHEPPAFGVDRGDAVGAYAIIKLKNGEVLREVLDKKEIEKIRAVSKSATGPAWKNWWGEMARKAALRRCAKAAPTSADIDAMLARDDEDTAGPTPMVDITEPEPEPPRGAAITHQPKPEPEPQYFVTDCDGEVWEFVSRDEAQRALEGVFAEAHRRGPSHVAAARENNAELIREVGEPQPQKQARGDDRLAAEPKSAARDELWWDDERLVITARDGREFQALMHQRMREARNWAEIERLREDNPMIDTLDKATKQDVLNALADRERALRAQAGNAVRHPADMDAAASEVRRKAGMAAVEPQDAGDV